MVAQTSTYSGSGRLRDALSSKAGSLGLDLAGMVSPPPDHPRQQKHLLKAYNPAEESGLAHGRVYNFSPGPACLPLDVLEECQRDLLNWKGTGLSVMEMSHRSPEFVSIITQAEADLRALLRVPANFRILFLQGGATSQFSAVPLNLAPTGEETIDYVVTGYWSRRAVDEAQRHCRVHVALQTDGASIPDAASWSLSPDSKFVHYCDNETIGGVQFHEPPEVGHRLLIADMSSSFLGKPIDFSRFGLIYAGAHKNVGPAGVTIAIVRDDLIGHARPTCPAMLDYRNMADWGSMYNTPPCWAVYVCGLVFKKLLLEGGVEAAAAANDVKAAAVYDAIDASRGFYSSRVTPAVRSLMNIPFSIPGHPALEAAFVKEAAAAGLRTLEGHATVGHLRASIYNAMPLDGCRALAAFMRDFAAKHHVQ